MNWLYWVGTTVAVVLSFWVGKRISASDVVLEAVKQRDQSWHENFVKPWAKKYNRVLQNVVLASTEGYCDSNKRNVILIAENERLRRKAIRLAFRYSYFRHKYENRPMEDDLSKMYNIIEYMIRHMIK